MKKFLYSFVLTIIFLTGFSLLLYPVISDYINSRHQTEAISIYERDVANLNEDQYKEIWQAAVDYNIALAKTGNIWKLSSQRKEEYNSKLNISGKGVMGYIEIPKIRVSLPIRHGTSEITLQNSVGHVEGSSLPVGGESTHAVLSGHRGLPTAKLFSNLDKLEAGDLFVLRILDETLTYEVDQILTVLPNEISELQIKDGKDYCTLVTCTPYGVNSHRLLVRGHRVENQDMDYSARVTADALQIEAMIVASVLGASVLLVLIIIVFIKKRRRNREV